jgi:hypothetical protein
MGRHFWDAGDRIFFPEDKAKPISWVCWRCGGMAMAPQNSPPSPDLLLELEMYSCDENIAAIIMES